MCPIPPLFPLTIALFALLRLTDYDYPFGIFKLSYEFENEINTLNTRKTLNITTYRS
jgi:hypothetical protein